MTQKVFITKSGNANFYCPECGEVRHMDVSKFKKTNKKVKLKCTCKCKHVFSVTLERRLHVRKEVCLHGNIVSEEKKYPINVMDISRFGLMVRTKGILDYNIDEKIVVEFILDDAQNSKVSKEVIIRTINKEKIGVEFLAQDHYDRFGTYLLFHFN